MRNRDLIRLLEDRHADCTFVPECKKGPAGSRILDGWALLNTWSPLTAIGYEIKRSRSDWVRDQKFHEYRDVCHLLYVVAEKGVVVAGELPPGVGLLEPVGTGDGRRLVTRVKAARQEPDWKALAFLMTHVLMWKSQPAHHMTREARVAHWREYAEGRADFQRIGRGVAGRMRVRLSEALAREQAAETSLRELRAAKDILDALKVRPGTWDIRHAIETAIRADTHGTVRALDEAKASIEALRRRIDAAVQAVQASEVSA